MHLYDRYRNSFCGKNNPRVAAGGAELLLGSNGKSAAKSCAARDSKMRLFVAAKSNAKRSGRRLIEICENVQPRLMITRHSDQAAVGRFQQKAIQAAQFGVGQVRKSAIQQLLGFVIQADVTPGLLVIEITMEQYAG